MAIVVIVFLNVFIALPLFAQTGDKTTITVATCMPKSVPYESACRGTIATDCAKVRTKTTPAYNPCKAEQITTQKGAVVAICRVIEDPAKCYQKNPGTNCNQTNGCYTVNVNALLILSAQDQVFEGDNTDKQNIIADSEFPTLEDPLSSVTSPQALLGKIINIIMGVVGSLALIMLIFGGISWMTAGGSEEKVKKSMGIIVWSVLGLAVIFLSYALVRLLITNAVL